MISSAVDRYTFCAYKLVHFLSHVWASIFHQVEKLRIIRVHILLLCIYYALHSRALSVLNALLKASCYTPFLRRLHIRIYLWVNNNKACSLVKHWGCIKRYYMCKDAKLSMKVYIIRSMQVMANFSSHFHWTLCNWAWVYKKNNNSIENILEYNEKLS